jgi:hypothetical protein
MGAACGLCGGGERWGAYTVLVGKPEGKSHLEDLSPEGRIILKWVFNEWDGDMDWIDMDQNRDRGRGEGTCNYGTAPSGSIKCEEFLD